LQFHRNASLSRAIPQARYSQEVVPAVQASCDRCGAALVPNAAYCEKCGARTRRAKRLVRVAIRVEAVFFLAVVAMVGAFIWVYAAK
jgi:ribosomal protein L40E